ncbi:hypothetical protein JCM5350_005884 [Sporobolomyces pararoseus]
MSSTRSISKHNPRYHYALLSISSTNGAIAVDRPTLLQILQKELGEWFGTMGGVNSNEVEVLNVQTTTETDGVSEREGVTNDRTVLLRFPRSMTPQLLTSLPLISSSNYRIQLLNDSSDLSRLNGYAGQGNSGYEKWKQSLLA